MVRRTRVLCAIVILMTLFESEGSPPHFGNNGPRVYCTCKYHSSPHQVLEVQPFPFGISKFCKFDHFALFASSASLTISVPSSTSSTISTPSREFPTRVSFYEKTISPSNLFESMTFMLEVDLTMKRRCMMLITYMRW